MKYIVVPQWYGACKKGTDAGSLRLAEIFERECVREYTSVPISSDVIGHDALMPFFSIIDEVNRTLCESVHSALSSGIKVITLGGDHSVSWGSIAGVLKYNPEVGVIYLDAHGDCNIAERSMSHHIHGMHMAYLMGFGTKEYVGRYTTNILPLKNILYVGARSLDPYEVELINERGISKISSDFINTSMPGTLEKISVFMSRFKKIHVSLDIDILDPSIAPGTGVPEPDGISEESLYDLLDLILNRDKVDSIDFVEYNPLLDIDGRTDMAVQRLAKRLSLL